MKRRSLKEVFLNESAVEGIMKDILSKVDHSASHATLTMGTLRRALQAAYEAGKADTKDVGGILPEPPDTYQGYNY